MSEGMSMIYLNSSYREKNVLKLSISKFKKFISRLFFWRVPTQEYIIDF